MKELYCHATLTQGLDLICPMLDCAFFTMLEKAWREYREFL
ncbi:hypothetical protein [uncultured Acinetobacter sp.]|nr:hypothetical protein [uncultured Acinetobacter sp.]